MSKVENKGFEIVQDLAKEMRHMSNDEQDCMDDAIKEITKNAKPIKRKEVNFWDK